MAILVLLEEQLACCRRAKISGDLVRGDLSWQDYLVTDGRGFGGMQKVACGTPPNLALGLFGINGLTSYFGMIEIGKIKAGETVLVSAAAGATGSVGGQIAKIKGCRVIGTAGGTYKCDWLVNEAHFDAASDYKREDIGAWLSELCPNGIDVLFDNVGGEVLNDVLARINVNARIVLCGSKLESRNRHAAARPGRTSTGSLTVTKAVGSATMYAGPETR